MGLLLHSHPPGSRTAAWLGLAASPARLCNVRMGMRELEKYIFVPEDSVGSLLLPC